MQSAKRYAIIVGIVLGIVIVVGITLAAIFGVLLELLYIILAILAILLIGATLFQIYSILMLVRTITTVRDEMKPLLSTVQETVGIVKDTAQTAGRTATTIGNAASFTSEIAVRPGIRAVATAVAGQEMVRVFLGKGRVRSRAEQRRQEQLEAMEAANAEVRGGV
ncbi:MAG: hypothetical protein H0U76_15075 [Ktedonobacteraceae bacterium]|nr:hypothetical protein [Ktedonobacteraceae bacterium]